MGILTENGILGYYKKIYNPELESSMMDATVSSFAADTRIQDKFLGLAFLTALDEVVPKNAKITIYGRCLDLPPSSFTREITNNFNSRLHAIEIQFDDVHVTMDLGGVQGLTLFKHKDQYDSESRNLTEAQHSGVSTSDWSKKESNAIIICLSKEMLTKEGDPSPLYFTLFCGKKFPDKFYIPQLLGDAQSCRDFRETVCKKAVEILRELPLPKIPESPPKEYKLSKAQFDETARTEFAEKVEQKFNSFYTPAYKPSQKTDSAPAPTTVSVPAPTTVSVPARKIDSAPAPTTNRVPAPKTQNAHPTKYDCSNIGHTIWTALALNQDLKDSDIPKDPLMRAYR